MPLIARKTVLLAKIESSYGVDPVPTGASNAIYVRNLSMTPLEQITVPREAVQPYLGNFKNLIAAGYAMIECEVEMAGAGTSAATPPKYGPLLRGCAMGETIAADVQYKPVSTGFESLTIYFYKDGILHKMLGARGTVSLRLNRLQIPVFAFKFTGLYVAASDAAMATPTFTGFQEPLPSNNTNTTGLTLHSFATGVMDNINIDLNNNVVYRHLIGSESVIITDRAPSGSILLEAVLVAGKDWWTNARNGTLGALSFVQGTVAFNKVQIDAPSVQIMRPRYSQQDGIEMLGMDLAILPTSAGNDELVIKTF
jgi:hypothetical protein